MAKISAFIALIDSSFVMETASHIPITVSVLTSMVTVYLVHLDLSCQAQVASPLMVEGLIASLLIMPDQYVSPVLRGIHSVLLQVFVLCLIQVAKISLSEVIV